VTPESKI